MKTVVITGARQWWEPRPIEHALRGADRLIVGDCPPDRETRSSADALALMVALRWDIIPLVLAASPSRAEYLRQKGVAVRTVSDWEVNGDGAGPLRNAAIASEARASLASGTTVVCHAFPLPGSRGTYDCTRKLEAAGFEVHVHPGQARRDHIVPRNRGSGLGR